MPVYSDGMDSVGKRFVLKSAVQLIAGLLAFTACSTAPEDDSARSEVEYRPASLQNATALDDVVLATTRLGSDALQFRPETANVILSPASITTAFAMLAEGAEGEAAQELEEFLGAGGRDRTLAFSALQAALAEFDGDPKTVQQTELPEHPMLHMANQAVVRDNGDVKETYLDVLAEYYDAGIQEVDFGTDAAKKMLDAWVNHHTGGLIDESAVEPTDNTLMVLQNAILLAAAWDAPFDQTQTQQRDFTLPGGELVQVDSMRQSLPANYTEYQGAQIIRLPYTQGFAMDVVLPPKGESARGLSAVQWLEISELLSQESDQTEVDLVLPKMEIAAPRETTDIRDFLSTDQGLQETIAGNSLDGIMESDLWIEGVDHQAILQVDEAGTVAAAVTEIEVAEVSAPVVMESIEMHVDRPFVLRIVHTETQWPLFMAAVSDPR